MYGHASVRHDVIACASSAKSIDFGSPYGSVPAVGIEALDQIKDADGLLHLAFLTRERIAEMGVERYIELNRVITSRVADFISRHPSIPIITISSGATAVCDKATVNLMVNPYAALKQEEEALWQRSSAARMATVFRVYAASGRFIKDPSVFALSDFLSKALVGKQIQIRSERPVIRSYVHVGTMMRLVWAMLEQPDELGFRQVNAAMQTLSLVELAEAVSTLWSLPKPSYRINPSLEADDYRAVEEPFLRLLAQYGIKVPTLAEQLQETACSMA